MQEMTDALPERVKRNNQLNRERRREVVGVADGRADLPRAQVSAIVREDAVVGERAASHARVERGQLSVWPALCLATVPLSTYLSAGQGLLETSDKSGSRASPHIPPCPTPCQYAMYQSRSGVRSRPSVAASLHSDQVAGRLRNGGGAQGLNESGTTSPERTNGRTALERR